MIGGLWRLKNNSCAWQEDEIRCDDNSSLRWNWTKRFTIVVSRRLDDCAIATGAEQDEVSKICRKIWSDGFFGDARNPKVVLIRLHGVGSRTSIGMDNLQLVDLWINRLWKLQIRRYVTVQSDEWLENRLSRLVCRITFDEDEFLKDEDE